MNPHMVLIRNRLSSLGTGGPRQFTEIRNKFLVSAHEGDQDDVESRLDELGLRTKAMRNSNVIVAEPHGKIEDVIESLSQVTHEVGQAIEEIQRSREQGGGVVEPTTNIIKATGGVIQELNSIPGVRTGRFVNTYADFGPENLRMNISDLRTVTSPEEENQTYADINKNLEMERAWEIDRGSNAVVAIFDTGYSEDLFNDSRIEATFHGDEVDSVYESSEGHGTMTAGAAAARKSEEIPYNGTAPGSDVILVRITDGEGQIRGDIIAEAWDWLMSQVDRLDKPVVSNHSYGTPICSTVQRAANCDDPLAETINIANEKPGLTTVMAAGNEAMYCGHRLSGMTNGITAHNSLGGVITVGALLSDGRDAQRYSSHGRGDCSPRADPKPNVSYRLPKKTYYGGEDGWIIKDMSTGIFGSGGGTSHASPSTAGALALIQSRKYSKDGEAYHTEELKRIIEEHSTPPRPTQVNQFGSVFGSEGWDARFGYGQFMVADAIEAI